MTLFDFSHLAPVIVIWPLQKLICYCTVIALFYFVFPSTSPWGFILTEGVLRYEFGGGGGIFGGAYFRNFTVITTLLRPKQPNRYYVSFMQTRFCPPAFISLGDSLSPDKPETRTKYETVFLCLNN